MERLEEKRIAYVVEYAVEDTIAENREILQGLLPERWKCIADAEKLEILQQAAKRIHGFCCGFGTGGTLSGIGQTLRRFFPEIVIWAVEPKNAAILSGGSITSHLQMGIGDGLIPENLDRTIYDHVAVISDEEALETARRLAREEGILCGISGGTNVAAALRMAKKLGRGKTVVTILPDTGERYLSTPLFEKI